MYCPSASTTTTYYYHRRYHHSIVGDKIVCSRLLQEIRHMLMLAMMILSLML
jgi:hypothetical protein